MNIVTAHDENRYYADMAKVAKVWAKKQGYALHIEQETNVKHTKATLLQKYLTGEWALWMDADSMLMKNIDDLQLVDCDMALSVKEPEVRSKKYGSYLYSGFVLVKNTTAAKRFLDDWSNCRKAGSDQFNLHTILHPYLDDSIYGRVGEVVNFGGLRVHLLDPDVYCHQTSIRRMILPPNYVSVIHFKGSLQKLWPDYKKLL